MLFIHTNNIWNIAYQWKTYLYLGLLWRERGVWAGPGTDNLPAALHGTTCSSSSANRWICTTGVSSLVCLWSLFFAPFYHILACALSCVIEAEAPLVVCMYFVCCILRAAQAQVSTACCLTSSHNP